MDGKKEEFGLTTPPHKSRRHPMEILANLDFADDIALLTYVVEQAQNFFHTVESECKKVDISDPQCVITAIQSKKNEIEKVGIDID